MIRSARNQSFIDRINLAALGMLLIFAAFSSHTAAADNPIISLKLSEAVQFSSAVTGWSFDSKSLAMASATDGKVYVFDLGSRIVTPIPNFQRGGMTTLAWSRDDRAIFLASPEEFIEVMRANGHVISDFHFTSDAPDAVRIGKTMLALPDGKSVIFVNTNHVNPDILERLNISSGHIDEVVKFSAGRISSIFIEDENSVLSLHDESATLSLMITRAQVPNVISSPGFSVRYFSFKDKSCLVINVAGDAQSGIKTARVGTVGVSSDYSGVVRCAFNGNRDNLVVGRKQHPQDGGGVVQLFPKALSYSALSANGLKSIFGLNVAHATVDGNAGDNSDLILDIPLSVAVIPIVYSNESQIDVVSLDNGSLLGSALSNQLFTSPRLSPNGRFFTSSTIDRTIVIYSVNYTAGEYSGE